MKASSSIEELLHQFDIMSINAELDRILEALSREIQNGLNGQDCGLPMVPMLCLPEKGLRPKKTDCISIDIGGTTMKSAHVYTEPDGRIYLSELKTGAAPGLDTEITEEEYFRQVSAFAGIDGNITNVAVSFSHYMSPLPEYDAKILGWCKEVCPTGASGKSIARIFRETAGVPGLNVRVTNDSVAALLGSIDSFDRGRGTAGVIVGTGFNICWIDDSGTVFNTEAGDSKAFPQCFFDRSIDNASANPGCAQTEKMVSGKYLEHLISYCVSETGRMGIISDAERYSGLSLKEYCDILLRPESDAENLVAYAVKTLLERSAGIAALCCSAFLKHNQCSGGKLIIGTEGSVINRAPGYKDVFLRQLEKEFGQNIEIVLQSSDCAGIKGAAKLMWL